MMNQRTRAVSVVPQVPSLGGSAQRDSGPASKVCCLCALPCEVLKFAEDLKSASLRTSACRHPQGSPVSKNYVECAREGARCRLRYVVRGCVSFTKSLTKPQPHLHVQQGCSRTRQSLNGVWCVLCILSVQAATHQSSYTKGSLVHSTQCRCSDCRFCSC